MGSTFIHSSLTQEHFDYNTGLNFFQNQNKSYHMVVKIRFSFIKLAFGFVSIYSFIYTFKNYLLGDFQFLSG